VIEDHDPSGNTLTQSDGLGHATSYTVDDLGRTTKVTDAISNAIQTNYSLAGEVTSVVNGRGKTNSYTLDRVGRTTAVSYFKADGTTVLSQSFGYDSDGNMTSFSDTDVAQTTVAYDHLNRTSTVTAPSPLGTTTYSYFMDGAVSSVVDATGTSTFTEDHLGRVATMVDPLNTSPNNTTSYTFDAAGRLTGRTEANGIVTTATYTGMDQLASKTEVAGSTTLASWTSITYDLAENRTGETLSYYAGNPYPDAQAGTATYKYDSLNQISQASIPNKTTVGFGFDAAHNLTSNAGTTQAYNNNESLQTVGGATTGSDADGNQLKDVPGNSLSWNSLDQLEKFSTSETYTYDALGRLTKVINGSNNTQFVYRGLSGEVIEELNGSNGVIRSYAWDTTGRQLYVKSGSSVWYEITDPHGDVAALATATALVGTEHFDVWGNLLGPSGTTTPFGYQGAAGSWSDLTTGFVSMGARWYYPKVGEFLSSDPASGLGDPAQPLTESRWGYAGNNPIAVSDPSGYGCPLRLATANGVASAVFGGCSGGPSPFQVLSQTPGLRTATPLGGGCGPDGLFDCAEISVSSQFPITGQTVTQTPKNTEVSAGHVGAGQIPLPSYTSQAQSGKAKSAARNRNPEPEAETAPQRPALVMSGSMLLGASLPPVPNCQQIKLCRDTTRTIAEALEPAVALVLMLAAVIVWSCATDPECLGLTVLGLLAPELDEVDVPLWLRRVGSLVQKAVRIDKLIDQGAATIRPLTDGLGSPSQLVAGRDFESRMLDSIGAAKNTDVWRPSTDQIDSAAFKVIVGDAKYTAGGLPVGVIPDSAGLEIKGGASTLVSSYQLRLMVFRSLMENEPLRILTTRPVGASFEQWLSRWGVTISSP